MILEYQVEFVNLFLVPRQLRVLITICQNKPFGITGIIWKAITVLCGFSSLFEVFSSLCLVVTSSLHYVMWFLQYVL